MSRVKEGTTALGFKCDAAGCDRKAAYTPVYCVPHEGYPIEIRGPFIGMIDTHVCAEHRRAVTEDDVVSKKMRDQIEAIAVMNNSRPAFKRAYIKFAPTISDEYQRFQEAAGLVAPGDAQAKGTLILPEGITLN